MENVLSALHRPTVRTATPRARVWTGRVLTGLIAAFLLFDAVCKLIPLAFVLEASARLGFDATTIRILGAVLTAATLLHLFPRTQLFGAVLVTTYLGGATATHVLTHTPFWFPVAMGVLLWLAYYLRDDGLRAFLSTPSSTSRA